MATRPPRRRPRRVLRIIVLTLGAILILGVGGIAAFVATFNPNSYKPQIIAAVQSATGRQLALNGPIHLALGLEPTLEVSDVAFSNPTGFSRPQMATLQKLDIQLALLPLLSKQVRIDRLVLVKPDILLETNAQGQSNWTFGASGPATPAPAPAAGTPSSASTAPPQLSLSSLRIEDGTLAMRNGDGSTTTLALKRLDARAASPDAPLHLEIDATYNGAPVNLTADTGPLSRLENPASTTPWPLKLVGTAAGAKLGVDGTIAQPTQGRGLALDITADVPDLAALGTLAGTTLPPLKTVKAQFKLADSANGQTFTVSDLVLSLPQLDLAGGVSFTQGATPTIKATLSAKQIDLDALKAAMAGSKPAGSTGAAPAAPPAAKGHYVIPDTPLPFDALRPLTLDATVSVADLKSGGTDYKGLTLHAVDQKGQLTVDPFGVDAPGGHIDAKVTVDANASPPAVTLSLRAPSLALATLLKALNKPGYASGNLEIRADLKGAGDSPHAIAASLDGPIGIALAKGEIDSQVLGGLMSGLLQQTQIANLASKAGMSALNCFALRLDTAKGIGTVNALLLDSSTLGLTGTGGLNFANETLDLHLKPTVGIAGTNIAAPVIVGGTFADPSTKPDAAGLVTGNVGTAAKLALGASTGGLGLIIGSAVEKKLEGDVCAAPLALARFAQPPAAASSSGGTTAAPSQPKTQSPVSGAANALKKLFQ